MVFLGFFYDKVLTGKSIQFVMIPCRMITSHVQDQALYEPYLSLRLLGTVGTMVGIVQMKVMSEKGASLSSETVYLRRREQKFFLSTTKQ